VVASNEYEAIIRVQTEELGYDSGNLHVLVEPQAKNTLPAILSAVKAIREDGEDDVAVVFASDHHIPDSSNMIDSIKSGAPYASEYIYTFGIKPSKVDTGFGYINPGEALDAGYKIQEFKEKPHFALAKEYVKKGYLWNSGMFMFDTALFEREVQKHAPDVYAAFELATPEERYEKSPNISIDYGIMEKSPHTAVLPIDLAWSDVGNFASFYETYAEFSDEEGNIGFNDEEFIDSASCIVYTEEEKKYVLIGARDLVLIDQPDALLIVDRSRVQDVKKAVDILGASENPKTRELV
jgi:mannose-1-phosphate guanylyltransferase/mannose-6-phosphate isomerase